MRFFIPLLLCGLAQSNETRPLFTKEELKAIERLKSPQYLVLKREEDLKNKGKESISLILEAQSKHMKKKLKQKNEDFFNQLTEQQLYDEMMRDFIK